MTIMPTLICILFASQPRTKYRTMFLRSDKKEVDTVPSHMETSHSPDSQVKLCVCVNVFKVSNLRMQLPYTSSTLTPFNSRTRWKNAAQQPINHTGKQVDYWCNNNRAHFYQSSLLQNCSMNWHERNDEVCLGLCCLLHVRGLKEDTVLVSRTVHHHVRRHTERYQHFSTPTSQNNFLNTFGARLIMCDSLWYNSGNYSTYGHVTRETTKRCLSLLFTSLLSILICQPFTACNMLYVSHIKYVLTATLDQNTHTHAKLLYMYGRVSADLCYYIDNTQLNDAFN